MEIPHKTIVHEVGHWITAALAGLERYGIYFFETGGGLTFGSVRSMESDMAGLLAVVELCPETLEKHLRTAFSHSVIISDDHPHRDLLSAEDITWMDGANTDFEFIHREADRRHWIEPERTALLRQVESRVKSAITLNRDVLMQLTELIKEWTSAQVEWEFNHIYNLPALTFYTNQGADLIKKLITPPKW